LEYLEYSFQVRVHQWFHMRGFLQDCQISTRLPQLRRSEEQRAKARCVQFSQIVEVQYYANLPGLDQPVQLISKIQILLSERELSIQIQNLDSFMLSMDHFERLISVHDVKTSFRRIQVVMLFRWSGKNSGAKMEAASPPNLWSCRCWFKLRGASIPPELLNLATTQTPNRSTHSCAASGQDILMLSPSAGTAARAIPALLVANLLGDSRPKGGAAVVNRLDD
jgi:hypothetical protein